LPRFEPHRTQTVKLVLMDEAGKVTVSLLQMSSGQDLRRNLEKCEAFIERAAAAGAQIVIPPAFFRLPDFWHCMDYDYFALAETIPGPTTEALSKLAAARQVVVVASLFERRAAGVYHSSAAVIDADGRVLGVYRQMHLCIDPRSQEGFYFSPGDLGFKAFATRHAKIGVLLGWDQWYPEAARIAALAGSDILVCPGAWRPRDTADSEHQYAAWEAMQRSHAIANSVFLAAANRAGRPISPSSNTGDGPPFWGKSLIADPSGRIAVQGGTREEEIVSAECDLTQVDVVRTHWPFLRDRRLDAYQNITKHTTE
jgi:N-carbamoylputrescine amidase